MLNILYQNHHSTSTVPLGVRNESPDKHAPIILGD
jgi:hypothetical protein